MIASRATWLAPAPRTAPPGRRLPRLSVRPQWPDRPPLGGAGGSGRPPRWTLIGVGLTMFCGSGQWEGDAAHLGGLRRATTGRQPTSWTRHGGRPGHRVRRCSRWFVLTVGRCFSMAMTTPPIPPRNSDRHSPPRAPDPQVDGRWECGPRHHLLRRFPCGSGPLLRRSPRTWGMPPFELH